MTDPHSQTALEQQPGKVTPNGLPKGAPPSTLPANPPPSGGGKIWLWILLLLLIGGAVYYFYFWKKAPAPGGQAEETPAAGSKGGRGGRGGGATPVVAVKSTRGNIAVYYTNVGSVTPIYTVSVKSRVDGQLMALHYKEGDLVKAGDLLAEIDPRPYQAQLNQYEGQLRRDQALLANAKVDQSRYETLLAQNAIPEQQLATQKSLVEQNEGVVKIDQGLIDAVKVNLAYCHISAPITGRIGLRLVDPGNIVHSADSNGLLVITQLQPISVIFPVAEDQLPAVLQKVQSGQRLPVDAFDREGKKKLASGSLTTTDNVIDQTTGTLKLRATFDNSRNELFPNQFINARLLVQQKNSVILLPTAAIQRNTQAQYVWIVKPDNSVSVQQITVGTTEGDQSEIMSGLEEGVTVIMTGVDKLQEGGKVTVQFEGDRRNSGAAGARPGAPGSDPGTPAAPGTGGRGQGAGKRAPKS